MPDILSSKESSIQIEEIMRNSNEFLFLLTPLFKLSENFYQLLKNASERGVKITVIFCSEELNPFEKNIVSELPDIEICQYSDLNSRCCFTEKEMLITSMDLYDLHERIDGDVSVLIRKEEDKELYAKSADLYESFYAKSLKIISDKITDKKVKAQACHGFCIRCAMPITYNPLKPYCRQCMNELNKNNEVDTVENYCHSCAQPSQVNLKSPLCSNCSVI